MSRARHRVLVVEDSAYMRKVISDILNSDSSLNVVGTAKDGVEALALARQLRPDVITMDVEMPRMDGITCTRHLMREVGVPVVMLSSLTQDGASATLDALSAGAVDFVHKPGGPVSPSLDSVRDEITHRVKLAAQSRPRPVSHSILAKQTKPLASPGQRPQWLVLMAASTGGPGALLEIFSELDCPNAAFLVVQHMPAGFTPALARRLDMYSALSVREASGGELPEAGVAYLAPGGMHMSLGAGGRISVHDGPLVHGVKPAADVLMESAVKVPSVRFLGVVLTGMGYDGAKGMAAIRRAGGRTIVQDEATCVVYGMPRAVAMMGNAERAVPCHQIAEAIMQIVSQAG